MTCYSKISNFQILHYGHDIVLLPPLCVVNGQHRQKMQKLWASVKSRTIGVACTSCSMVADNCTRAHVDIFYFTIAHMCSVSIRLMVESLRRRLQPRSGYLSSEDTEIKMIDLIQQRSVVGRTGRFARMPFVSPFRSSKCSDEPERACETASSSRNA